MIALTVINTTASVCCNKRASPGYKGKCGVVCAWGGGGGGGGGGGEGIVTMCVHAQ